MPEQLIQNGRLVADRWQRLEMSEDADLGALSAAPILLPASLWCARRDQLLARTGEIGVSLAPGFPLESLAEDIGRFSLIAVEFPKFADGRGYSTASLLRQRYGYRGELRAVGDVGRDQMFYLQRVGFNAFLIPEGRDAEDALQGLTDFPDTYQGAADQPLPLFRRRAV
ncbi:MAG: DUF934 domain-containing protein [Rhodocyclales bacterium]|nr:DUF934 domain-containing protein [Rhodocyclales bacterium]